MSRRKGPIDLNPMNSIGAIISLILFFMLLFYLAKGLFWILGLVAPVLLVATLIIDYRVVTGYFKMIFNFFKTKPLIAIGLVLFTIFLSPVVATFLFGKAMLNRKLGQFTEAIKKKEEGQYAEYEELDDFEDLSEEFPEEKMELPKIEKPIIIEKPQQQAPKNKSSNEYEDLFGE